MARSEAIAPAAEARVAAPAPSPPQPEPVAPMAQHPPVVAARVLAISESLPPQPGTVQCARCQGQNDATARFCKYCGSPLAQRVTAEASLAPEAALGGAVVHAPPPQASAERAAPSPVLDVPATIQTRAAAAAPAPQPALARLIVVLENGSDGVAHALDKASVSIGQKGADIAVSNDPYVSPLHARLERKDGTWYLEDLGSLNGVYRHVRRSHPLQNHDLILLGSQVLQFHLVSDEERQLGPVSQHGTRVFGTKPVHRLARLDQRTTAGLVGDVYYVHRDETVLGREVGDIVFTADAFLSRRHAVVRRDPASNAFALEDLGSSNGTFLALRARTALEHDDRIRIGQHLFRFEDRSSQAVVNRP